MRYNKGTGDVGTAFCCRAFYRQAMRYSRISPAPPQGGTLGRAARTARASPDPAHEPVGSQGSDSLKGIAFDGRLRPSGGSPRRMALPSLRVGSADRSFPGGPEKPENSGTSIYGSRIRRQDARQQVGAGSACPSQQCRQEFSGKPRKTGEFGNFNLWFPNSSIGCAAAGGCRLSLPESAVPTGVFREVPKNRRIREL